MHRLTLRDEPERSAASSPASSARSSLSAPVLFSVCTSVAIVVIGLVRIYSETHERVFDGTPFALIQRIPYDGSLGSYLNVQWFKLLYAPAVASFAHVFTYF